MTPAKLPAGLRLAAGAAKRGRIPWRLRVKAWWEGYRLIVPKGASAPVETPAHGHEVRAPDKQLPWDDRRIGLVQEVWGDGFDRPGGGDAVLGLLKPCGLDPSMNVIELGAGLGGATRALSQAFGNWIDGLESEPELARVGQSLSEIAGLAKKARIREASLAELDLKRNRCDVLFAREAFFQVADKSELLRRVRDGLKPRGQLLFTDYVLAHPEADDPALQAWRASEPEASAPWAIADYKAALKELKFDIRISEDRSDMQIAAIERGWSEFLRAAARDGRLAGHGDLALREADLWTRRANALKGGNLRLYRLHAIKSGGDQSLAG